MSENKTTQEKILDAAKVEFVQKGFAGASLRSIAAAAGATTGALYRYYDSKETLYTALVGEKADELMRMFAAFFDSYQAPRGSSAAALAQDVERFAVSRACEVARYVCENREVFGMLMFHSRGTAYDDYSRGLMLRAVLAVYKLIAALNAEGASIPMPDRKLCVLLVSGIVTPLLEAISRDMPYEEAELLIPKIARFAAKALTDVDR